MGQQNIGPSDVTKVFTSAQFGVGARFEDYSTGIGKVFRFVKVSTGSGAITVKSPLFWENKAGMLSGTVTADESDVNGTTANATNLVAGVALAAVSAAQIAAGAWICIQTGGVCTSVVTNGDNDGVEGDVFWITGDGTSNLTAAGAAPLYHRVLGVAIGAEASSAVDLLLTLDT